MANFGLLLVLIGGLCIAFGGFIWNKFSSKANAEKHKELLANGDSIKTDVDQAKEEVIKTVDEVKKQLTANERLFVSPEQILIPAKGSREIPIVVTNNFPYPIFMVVVEMKVVNGDLDMSTDLMPTPLPAGGVWQAKYLSYQIPQINGHTSENIALRINGNKYKSSSKITLKVVAYMKEPMPNFSMDSTHQLPKTIKVPDGFVPKVYKNDSTQ